MKDVKTYTAKEAQVEWDSARDAKRRMFLARVDMRESELAVKSWSEFSSEEKLTVHRALNQDFYSPVWFINKAGVKIFRIAQSIVHKPQAQLDDEEGAERWDAMSSSNRFNALLANGIGADADVGKFAQWSSLSPDLRVKLVAHFRAGVTSRVEHLSGRQEPAAHVDKRGSPQLALF